MKLHSSYNIIILVYYRLKGCDILSKKKLLSFILCLAVLVSCFALTDNIPTAIGGTTAVYESAEPVCPPESDFTYRPIPTNEPTKAVITGPEDQR